MLSHKQIRKQERTSTILHKDGLQAKSLPGGNHYAHNLNCVLHFYYFISVSVITEIGNTLNTTFIPISQRCYRMRWHLWLDSDSNKTSTALVHHIVVIVEQCSMTRLLQKFSPHLARFITVLMNGNHLHECMWVVQWVHILQCFDFVFFCWTYYEFSLWYYERSTSRNSTSTNTHGVWESAGV